VSTACTWPVNGPRVSALWVALFVMCQYSLIAHAQNGRSSAGPSPTLEEGNGSEVSGGFMPAWRRAGEDHGLRFSLQDTYDFQDNPTGGRTQMGTFFGRANGTVRLDLSKLVGIEGATIYSGSICSLISRTPFDTIVKAFT
jgi:carbohydrate-selective porin OprB